MKMGEDVDICTAQVAKIKDSVAKMSTDTMNSVATVKRETREELVTISKRITTNSTMIKEINGRLKYVEDEFVSLQNKVQDKAD